VVRQIISPTRAKIEHEDIPGYMPAMVMPLDVKNTNEFAGIKVGDQISFDMVVTADDGWIEKVKRTGQTGLNEPLSTNQIPHVRRVREVEPLSVGDVMPDYPFVTEEAKPIRLSDFKGQAIGFTFIFTRCPFPTFCPRMTGNFEKAAEELAKAGSPTNWHLLSISFDPGYDTPQRLKEHAKRFQRDAAKWNFVTGEMIDIDAITEQFGLVFANRNGLFDHNLRTVIVDATGHIRQIYIGNEWSVAEFVTEMQAAAEAKPTSVDAGANPKP
jgi:protein SCO1/2